MQTQEVAVAPSLRVILKSDSEILDEVTVIAYGTAKKNSLTGSVATIKSSDMEKLPVTSFEKALQGLSPGLQIASVSVNRVRLHRYVFVVSGLCLPQVPHFML